MDWSTWQSFADDIQRVGPPPRKPPGTDPDAPDQIKWRKDWADWWSERQRTIPTPTPPDTPDTKTTLKDRIIRSTRQILNDILDDFRIDTKHIKPWRGGILAPVSTAIDWIAFIVECCVFQVFLLEEACQIMARLLLDTMCPLQASAMRGFAETDFDFVLTFATGVYVAHAWTLAYSKSGYQAYFNACWILYDAALLIAGDPPAGIILD